MYASIVSLAVQPGLAPLAESLQSNDGGIGLDPTRWRSTLYKGGSEPGVLTLHQYDHQLTVMWKRTVSLRFIR